LPGWKNILLLKVKGSLPLLGRVGKKVRLGRWGIGKTWLRGALRRKVIKFHWGLGI